MSVLHLRGGNVLKGEVQISGAKNAASKMIIASLLTDEGVCLENVPLQQETAIATELVETVGSKVSFTDHVGRFQAKDIRSVSALELSRKNRLAILALAPLLHRMGEAYVPLLGGDRIGPRPVNFHLDALQKMGALIETTDAGYRATAPQGLRGTVIDLPYPSVGATETCLLAGVLASGRTVIRNAAIEPEVMSLIMMLQKMGAIVDVRVGRQIEIIGVQRLSGCTHRVLPDRLEVASFGAMALATRGEIFCKGADHRDVITFLNIVRRIGGEYEIREGGILFRGAKNYHGLQLETDTHPGFMTDWQQPIVAVLTQAEGTSVVHETVYEERFGYTEALIGMGADIALFSSCLGELPCRFKDHNYLHSAIINGPTPLTAADVTVPDIRAGLAYVIAGLLAEGESRLSGVEHLERGYEDLYGKLTSVGADLSIL